MRIVFLGTPPWAAAYLQPLMDAGHAVELVLTQPDKPGRRGRTPQPPATKVEAQRLGLPVFQPERANAPEAVRRVAEARPDVLLTVAYGQILRDALLRCAAIDALNVHYSLLPLLRGPAPVQHALLQGMTVTGVSVQRMAREVDAGDIYALDSLEIGPDENADSLCRRLTRAGILLVVQSLPAIESGDLAPTRQDHARASYAPLLEKSDQGLDFSRRARDVHNRVRAFAPQPGAYCLFQGKRLGVTASAIVDDSRIGAGMAGRVVEIPCGRGPVVATGQGLIELVRVHPEGRKEMAAASWLRGARVQPGDVLQSAVDKQ